MTHLQAVEVLLGCCLLLHIEQIGLVQLSLDLVQFNPMPLQTVHQLANCLQTTGHWEIDATELKLHGSRNSVSGKQTVRVMCHGDKHFQKLLTTQHVSTAL